jgi:integrase
MPVCRPPLSYAVASCVEDWLLGGLISRQPSTIENYQRLAAHAIGQLGAVRLKSLSARQVQVALEELAPVLSSRSLRLVHQIPERSIRRAQACDRVGCNVASLVTAPSGRSGRPSKSLTLGQASAVLDVAQTSPLCACVTLSLLSGLRAEELRSLLWTDVDLEIGTLAVYRSMATDRPTGGAAGFRRHLRQRIDRLGGPGLPCGAC